LCSAHLEALTELVWILNELHEYDDAIKVGVLALELDEKNAGLWRELGFALLKKEKHQRAAEALAVALKLNPKDISAWRYLAEPLDGLGEKKLAEQARKHVDQLMEEKER
jgi:uncharacterized protein HemY